ncbi:MAG: C40 family peptidase [Methylococcales bacterium]|nr:C40 family peptidase [Methylococcales bacterium]
MMTDRPFQQLYKSFFLVLILAQLTGCATSDKPAISTSGLGANPPTNNPAAREAMRLQGHPYVPGGESPGEGFDCSGLVHYVYQKQGLNLPRDTWSLAHSLPAIQPDQRQPGDLLFFTINTRPFSHVGIYVGQDKFIHAPSSQTGRVMMSDLKQPYWQVRFSAVRRPPTNQPLSANETANLLCLLN